MKRDDTETMVSYRDNANDAIVVIEPGPIRHERVVAGGILRLECRPPPWWRHWPSRGDVWVRSATPTATKMRSTSPTAVGRLP